MPFPVERRAADVDVKYSPFTAELKVSTREGRRFHERMDKKVPKVLRVEIQHCSTFRGAPERYCMLFVPGTLIVRRGWKPCPNMVNCTRMGLCSRDLDADYQINSQDYRGSGKSKMTTSIRIGKVTNGSRDGGPVLASSEQPCKTR